MTDAKLPIFTALSIENSAQMTRAMAWLVEDYKNDGLRPPPLPASVYNLVPSNVSVIETRAPNGRKMGKVLITDHDGTTLYELDWLVSID
jgi:hypothetical protein